MQPSGPQPEGCLVPGNDHADRPALPSRGVTRLRPGEGVPLAEAGRLHPARRSPASPGCARHAGSHPPLPPVLRQGRRGRLPLGPRSGRGPRRGSAPPLRPYRRLHSHSGLTGRNHRSRPRLPARDLRRSSCPICVTTKSGEEARRLEAQAAGASKPPSLLAFQWRRSRQAAARDQLGQPMYWPSSHSSIMRARTATDSSNRLAWLIGRKAGGTISSLGRSNSGRR